MVQQQIRELAEREARTAAQTGDQYSKLLAEGARYFSKQDLRKAARAYRAAIALRPDRPEAYYDLGAALANLGHHVEGAQRFLEAKGRYPVGSEDWAEATALAFESLMQEECAEVAPSQSGGTTRNSRRCRRLCGRRRTMRGHTACGLWC